MIFNFVLLIVALCQDEMPLTVTDFLPIVCFRSLKNTPDRLLVHLKPNGSKVKLLLLNVWIVLDCSLM